MPQKLPAGQEGFCLALPQYYVALYGGTTVYDYTHELPFYSAFVTHSKVSVTLLLAAAQIIDIAILVASYKSSLA